MYYAQLDSNNIVVAVSELHSEITEDRMIEISTFDNTLLGQRYDTKTKTFAPVTIVDTNNYIKVSTNKEVYKLSEAITANLTLVDSANNTIPLTKAYYVPIIRTSDNLQAAFVKLELVEGVATATFNLTQPGIYSVALDKCYPVPTAVLKDNFTFIVES